jgi:hypothetical protein
LHSTTSFAGRSERHSGASLLLLTWLLPSLFMPFTWWNLATMEWVHSSLPLVQKRRSLEICIMIG